MAKENICYTCGYRGEVAGSAHKSCRFRWTSSMRHLPTANPHGIKNGWFNFPIDFDPVWIEGQCEGYEEVADQVYVTEPFMELIRLLREGSGYLNANVIESPE
jgi:hypothetical protein